MFFFQMLFKQTAFFLYCLEFIFQQFEKKREADGIAKAITQMDPLELRFSQRKMRNVTQQQNVTSTVSLHVRLGSCHNWQPQPLEVFADGKLIADSVKQVGDWVTGWLPLCRYGVVAVVVMTQVRPIRRTEEEQSIYGAPYRTGAPGWDLDRFGTLAAVRLPMTPGSTFQAHSKALKHRFHPSKSCDSAASPILKKKKIKIILQQCITVTIGHCHLISHHGPWVWQEVLQLDCGAKAAGWDDWSPFAGPCYQERDVWEGG